MTTQLPTDPTLREPGQPSATTNGGTAHAAGTTPMTATSLEELRGDLARLRRGARVQIAQALREARSFGEGSNNDEYHRTWFPPSGRKYIEIKAAFVRERAG
jgi:hypothetical protein